MGRNEFKLNVAGFSRSLELKIKEQECKIPSLLLVSSTCIENCSWTSEDIGVTKTVVEEKNAGVVHPWVIKSLKLFLKTPEGQEVFGFFLNEGDSIVLDNDKVYTATCRGDFYDIHSLHFIEMNNIKGGALASTTTQLHQRCAKGDAYHWHANLFTTVHWMVKHIDFVKKKPSKFYLKVLIKIYISIFIRVAKEEKWKEERIIAQMCHSIGHEFFLHAWRNGIPAMKAWQNNDFEACAAILDRDKGDDGLHDHAAYVQKKNDEGLRKMKSFQASLKNLIGDELLKEVVAYHDKKYKALKNVVIPKESQLNTEY